MYAHRTDGRQRIRSASYVLTSVMQRFSTNQGTNLAAILTYYAVFALFPSLVALVSIMKLSGVGDTLVPEFASMIQQAVPDAGTAEMLVDLIEGFFSASGAGIGLVIDTVSIGALETVPGAMEYPVSICACAGTALTVQSNPLTTMTEA